MVAVEHEAILNRVAEIKQIKIISEHAPAALMRILMETSNHINIAAASHGMESFTVSTVTIASSTLGWARRVARPLFQIKLSLTPTRSGKSTTLLPSTSFNSQQLLRNWASTSKYENSMCRCTNVQLYKVLTL